MIALVRPISERFAEAITRSPGPPPDLARARAEHAAYVAALTGLVERVIHLPRADDQPDACFVEDMVVVADGQALLGRSGARGRRAEQRAVLEALPGHLVVHALPAGALLDGGDVMRVADRIYVGLSERTNAAGFQAIEALFGPRGLDVRAVRVRDALHLKCHCSSPGRDVVLLTEGFLDPTVFDGLQLALIPPSEAWGANVVGVGDQVLMAEGHPSVRAALNAHDFDPIPLQASEIAKADGSLTCLSILVD